MSAITLKVNGNTHTLDLEPGTPLLYALSDDLELRGPKFGCGLGQCGACTVLIEGKSVRSCTIPTSAAEHKSITTLEGLGSVAHPHMLQTAFIEEQAAQCGYCMNGMIMGAKVLLEKNPHPTVSDIKQSLNGYICRCGTHLRIIRAIQRAASSSVKA